jgi:hypothetical protein
MPFKRFHQTAQGGRSQREKVPGAGASGQSVRNRNGAAWGVADCASAPCGLTASAETEAGGWSFAGSYSCKKEKPRQGFAGRRAGLVASLEGFATARGKALLS